MEKTTYRVVIVGRVQGVWYRGWAIQEARRLHLSGWVRNRTDGSVEALFSGAHEAVTEMLEACRRGPPGAVVASVSYEPAHAPAEPGFHQRPTE